jgi:hypothetical protein
MVRGVWRTTCARARESRFQKHSESNNFEFRWRVSARSLDFSDEPFVAKTASPLFTSFDARDYAQGFNARQAPGTGSPAAGEGDERESKSLSG